MIDIYRSRRAKFRKCLWYARDERISTGDLSRWVLENTSSGVFYASESSAGNTQANQINNTFMFDANNITLVTEDKVEGLTRGCVVMYLNKAWLVDNIQEEIYIRYSEFDNKNQYATTYISLRR